MNLQVRFDHPLLPVNPLALKQKCMRPRAPVFVGVEVPLRPADRLVDESDSAGKAQPAGFCEASQEFLVAQVCNQHGFGLGWDGRHFRATAS